jgi:hypothetical protein
MIALTACGELAPPPKAADEPVAETPKPAEPEGPYYDLTKDEITSHPDWSSRNVTLMGIKFGDKTPDVTKSLGKLMGNPNILADEYQSYYQKNGVAIYTFKLTDKVTRMEVLQSFADRIADPKLKNLLVSGDLKQMRDIFGMEQSVEDKPDEMGTEYVYDSRGIRFIKYKNGITGLRFSDMKRGK